MFNFFKKTPKDISFGGRLTAATAVFNQVLSDLSLLKTDVTTSISLNKEQIGTLQQQNEENSKLLSRIEAQEVKVQDILS